MNTQATRFALIGQACGAALATGCANFAAPAQVRTIDSGTAHCVLLAAGAGQEQVRLVKENALGKPYTGNDFSARTLASATC